MREQAIQTKILDWLRSEGYYAIKTIVTSKAGVPDIVGCTPTGRFFAIEVKAKGNKPSRLQAYNLHTIELLGGIAMVAYSLDEVKEKLHEL